MKVLRCFVLDINSLEISVNKKLVSLLSLSVLLVLPGVAMAQGLALVQGLANTVTGIVLIVFTAAAIIYFLWYGILFLMASGDPTKVATARQGVLWGIVGVIVGVLAIGIVAFIRGTFGV